MTVGAWYVFLVFANFLQLLPTTFHLGIYSETIDRKYFVKTHPATFNLFPSFGPPLQQPLSITVRRRRSSCRPFAGKLKLEKLGLGGD